MSTLEEKKKHVFLSRASSRKELAETLHTLVLPLLQQNANNLEVARRRIEALEKRLHDHEQASTTIQLYPSENATLDVKGV